MLIRSTAYRDGTALHEVAIRDAAAVMQEPGAFVWAAFVDPSVAELEELRTAFALHPLAIEDIEHGNQQPKVEEYDNGALFVVMKVPEVVEGELAVGHLSVFVGARYVVTIRQNVRRSFAEVRERAQREPESMRIGPAYVLYALMDAVVDHYSPVLVSLRDDLERAEDGIFSANVTRDDVQELHRLKREFMTMKQVVSPLADAALNLAGEASPWTVAPVHQHMRDVLDHLGRIEHAIDSDREMVTTAITSALSLIQLQDSAVTKRLASYAALVAVPTMIAGIYGMNFRHMPELDWRLGYPLALGAMVAIDAYVFFRLRRAGWL